MLSRSVSMRRLASYPMLTLRESMPPRAVRLRSHLRKEFMRRLFPILALVAVVLQVAGHASGMAARGTIHARIGLGAVGATLVVHGLAFGHFRATCRRVDGLVGASGIPGWVRAQAEKNRRKASAYVSWGLGMAGLSAWSGWSGGGLGHLVLSASSLAFQVGAFAGLIVLVMTQAGLLRDVEGWARSALPASDP
jgi:hypothetical protein